MEVVCSKLNILLLYVLGICMAVKDDKVHLKRMSIANANSNEISRSSIVGGE